MRNRKPITLDAALDEYLLAVADKATKTQRWYREKLTAFVAWLKEQGRTSLGEVETGDIRRYLDALRETSKSNGQKRSSYTIHGYAQVIRGWFSWLMDEGLLTENPAERVKLPRVEKHVIRTFSQEQVRRLFAATRETREPLRNRAILATLLDTGIRLGELLMLRRADVALDGQRPSLIVHGKGNAWRRVPVGGPARVALERYMLATRDGAYVFTGRDGGPLSARLVEWMLRRLGASAGVTGIRVSPHSCRHSFAVAYLRAGGDVYRLSKILGHCSVTVTEHYLRDFPSDDVLRTDIDVLGALWR